MTIFDISMQEMMQAWQLTKEAMAHILTNGKDMERIYNQNQTRMYRKVDNGYELYQIVNNERYDYVETVTTKKDAYKWLSDTEPSGTAA